MKDHTDMYLQGEIISEYRMRGYFRPVYAFKLFWPILFLFKNIKKKNLNNIEFDHHNDWRGLPEKAV